MATIENPWSKLWNNEFFSMINGFDFVILNEIWSHSPDIDLQKDLDS